jgi:hypothetical protein
MIAMEIASALCIDPSMHRKVLAVAHVDTQKLIEGSQI